MAALTEKLELLGKGLYKDIPDVLTLTSLPTISELDYVSGEDFDQTMIEKILPQAVQEPVDFNNLLEIDYSWLCRCLRMLNYGPYHTTNSIFCSECGTSYGEYRVNLNSIGCKPLPEGFVNDIVISRDAFLDFNGDVHIKLPTIRQMITCYKDNAFQTASGKVNRELARICYMISEIGGKKGLTPVEVKLIIQKEFSPADYILLKDSVSELSDYGMRAGGSAQCPKCGSKTAVFLALTDDRFFRPTVGDLREWGNSRSSREAEDISRGTPAAV